MKTKIGITSLVLLCTFWSFSPLWARNSSDDTTARLLAQSINIYLTTVSESVKALANAYVRIYDQTPVMPEQDQQRWMAHAISDRQTIQFHPFATDSTPGFQAPEPSFLYYHGKEMTPKVWRELNAFTRLAPMFQVAYETFNDSWVYLTSENGAFLIYPYLPLDEAVHNYPPTKQVYYTAANFTKRTFGWTTPYLDLAGAGMMVTVSYPVYKQEELLGVLSRDITLTQLASQFLAPVISSDNHFIGLIMDSKGMAIACSQVEGMKEINTINTQAKTTVVYYRDKKSLDETAITGARTSSVSLYNQAGQSALEAATSAPAESTWKFVLKENSHQYEVTVIRIQSTGWFIITLQS